MRLNRRDSVAALLLALVLLVTASPAMATAASGAGANSAATPAAAKPYRIDLADPNDFVPQTNVVQCVGASMQMMLNIMGGNDRTAKTQLRLQKIARDLSGPTREGFERKGASVRGWTDGLNTLDAGPYRLVGTDTIDEAMRVAVRSIRETGRPVGLLVWAGRHAWVMSGFAAPADTRMTSSFRVTKAVVLDPLYPYGSKQWGRSPNPREAITISKLGEQFVPRRRGTNCLPRAATEIDSRGPGLAPQRDEPCG
jgi:hypothetical protein